MLVLKILAIIIAAAGFITVYAARWAVEKYKLDERVKCDFEAELTEEELMKYKFNKAMVNVKMLGMLIALPGLIILIIAFR